MRQATRAFAVTRSSKYSSHGNDGSKIPQLETATEQERSSIATAHVMEEQQVIEGKAQQTVHASAGPLC